MLEQQHRPGKGVPAAQGHGKGPGLCSRQAGGKGAAGHGGKSQHQQQPDRQEIPRLQADDPHHAHRRVGDVHRRHGTHGVDQPEHPQPAGAAASQCIGSGRAEQRSPQQHKRRGQADKRNGHILPAEQSQLADKAVILIQCSQQNRDITQRVLQNKQQLFAAVHGGAALPGNGAVVVAQQRAVLLHAKGQRKRARQRQHGADSAVQPHLPFGFAHNQRQHHPQQIDVGLCAVGKHTGQRVAQRRAVIPLGAGQQCQHQVVAAQQCGIIAQRGPHIQGHRHQHNAQKRRLAFVRTAQCRIAERCVGQQIDQPPAVQAAQCPQPKQPRQRHAQCPGQERQNQKADGFGDGICLRIALFPVDVLGKAIPDALHPAILAVLLQGIARRVVGLLGMGVRVSADPGRGVGVDPRAGKGRDQLVHIHRVAACGVKVKAAHGNCIGAQIMVCLIGGLHRRVGKGEQRAAQKDTGRAFFGKILYPAQGKRRRACQHCQPGTEGGYTQRRNAPGVQPIKDAPAIAGHHAQHRAQHQHESPPGCRMPHGG